MEIEELWSMLVACQQITLSTGLNQVIWGLGTCNEFPVKGLESSLEDG